MYVCGVGWCLVILVDFWWQQMEMFGLGVVVFDEEWLLYFGDYQDFGF